MAKLRNKGFTLLEILFALGIFGIAMGSLPTVLLSNIRANALARRLTTAAGFAQDQIEVVRNMRYLDVRSGQDTPTESGDVTVYTRTWQVTAGPTDSTKKVAVVVSWTDQVVHQVEIDAIIGN